VKVLFIDPPFQRFMRFHRYYYPMGLASMAAVLARAGHEVRVYDAERCDEGDTLSWTGVAGRHGDYLRGLSDERHPIWQEVEATVRDQKPDLVGITALSVKAASARRVAAIARKVNPGVPVVVGGDHPTIFPEQFLRDPIIDFAVRGEGEAAILDLVAYLERGRADAAIPAGVSIRTPGGIRHGPDRPPIMDLDGLPLPAIESLLGAASYRPVDFGSIMTSRGCPFGCTFCGVSTVWGRRVRNRSIPNVLAEIGHLNRRYGTTYFSFRDASFTLDRRRTEDFCDGLQALGLGVQWECLTRADLLDEDLVTKMAAAGCATIRLGIESGSPRILKYMNKPIDMDVTRRTARVLNRLGMYWSAYILIGTPQETSESVRETLDFLKEVDPPFITLARFAPIPGSAMYMELEQRGAINPEIDWSMECNQRLDSHYVSAMGEAEFEHTMAEVAAFVESHNLARSDQLHRQDLRLKATPPAAGRKESC
jgi:anaerobic magnesium-protoporphyrin IX monomethyl ester cyclase